MSETKDLWYLYVCGDQKDSVSLSVSVCVVIISAGADTL